MKAETFRRFNTTSKIATCFIGIFCVLGVSYNYWGTNYEIEWKQEIEEGRYSSLSSSPRRAVLSISSQCNVGNDSPCLPPFLPKRPMFLVSREHRLAVCKIEKVMSTFLTATVCYLNDQKAFRDADRTIHGEVWSQRFCKKKIEVFTTPSDTSKDKNATKQSKFKRKDDWQFLAVVREPISRFISGFINKCVIEYDKGLTRQCYRCEKNMTCFVKKLMKNAQMYVNSNAEKYLTFEGKHFFPQSWYCGFNEFPYSVVHYSTTEDGTREMSNKIVEFLKKSRVEQSDVEYIQSELNHKSPHANKNDSLKEKYERELWTNPYLMKKMVQLFYFDFVLFGFPLPFGV